MTTEPLEDKDFAKYEELCVSFGTVFSSLKWLQMYGPNLQVMAIYNKDKQLIGGWNYYKLRPAKLFSYFKTAPYSPHIGLFVENKTTNPASRNSFLKSITQLITDYIIKQKPSLVTLAFPKGWVDMQPLIWAKFKVMPNYTYQADLSNTTLLWNNFLPDRRSEIKKALKDGITTSQCFDYKEMQLLIHKTMSRKSERYDAELIRKILFDFANGNNSFCFVSYRNGKPIAGSFCVHDNKTAYYLLGGYDHEDKHSGAGPAAVWAAMQEAARRELKIFDFEGSMIPQVEKYFRGFGGEPTVYFTANKAWLAIELGLKFIIRDRF